MKLSDEQGPEEKVGLSRDYCGQISVAMFTPNDYSDIPHPIFPTTMPSLLFGPLKRITLPVKLLEPRMPGLLAKQSAASHQSPSANSTLTTLTLTSSGVSLPPRVIHTFSPLSIVPPGDQKRFLSTPPLTAQTSSFSPGSLALVFLRLSLPQFISSLKP